MQTSHRIALALATLSVFAPAALAQFTVNGSFNPSTPKYNRIGDGIAESSSSLSNFGSAVPYNVVPFTVSVTGSYDILMSGSFNGTLDASGPVTNYTDTFLTIYTGSFNPSSPVTNVYFVQDDRPGFGSSAGSPGVNFTAGTQYIFVGTDFRSGTLTGNWTFTVAATAPEPGSIALLGFGVTGVAGVVIRKRRNP